MTMNTSQVAQRAALLTKSDATEIQAKALYVGGAGDVAVQTVGGDTVTFSAVPAGAWIPVECRKLMSTNTTATLVVAVW